MEKDATKPKAKTAIDSTTKSSPSAQCTASNSATTKKGIPPDEQRRSDENWLPTAKPQAN